MSVIVCPCGGLLGHYCLAYGKVLVFKSVSHNTTVCASVVCMGFVYYYNTILYYLQWWHLGSYIVEWRCVQCMNYAIPLVFFSVGLNACVLQCVMTVRCVIVLDCCCHKLLEVFFCCNA